jgi:hypothetical protein
MGALKGGSSSSIKPPSPVKCPRQNPRMSSTDREPEFNIQGGWIASHAASSVLSRLFRPFERWGGFFGCIDGCVRSAVMLISKDTAAE